ncbi:flavodoxin family protein [Desulfobulbus rhabdoformis]|nr:flavodoxin family protein [Desulfobulbus rhabdoformis]
MKQLVVGISGSPVQNSNTDRLVQKVLQHTGLENVFFKLSDNTIQPCRACLGCVRDNECKVRDDFQKLAAQIKVAGALVVGGYPPYGSLDAFTKAFLERMFSLRHCKGLNRGKLAVTVITGNGRGTPGVDIASTQLQTALTHEGMEVIGQLKATGNVKCVSCGQLTTCPMSALSRIFNNNPESAPTDYCRVENQVETWQKAQDLGEEIGRRLLRQ